jgi:hypothetical protein
MSLGRHSEETGRGFRDTDRLVRELREAQADSDRRVDALIDTVDKVVHSDGPGVSD